MPEETGNSGAAVINTPSALQTSNADAAAAPAPPIKRRCPNCGQQETDPECFFCGVCGIPLEDI